MPSTKTRETMPRNAINLRVSPSQRARIDQAAQALGKNRSDFMLETACRAADAVLLDRRVFMLDEKSYEKFIEMLDRPPVENPRLARLLTTRAPWER